MTAGARAGPGGESGSLVPAPPTNGEPAVVSAWFDAAALAEVPEHDGSLETARRAAGAFAARAKAENTRLAYRAGVRAWCAWCDGHGLGCLPARPEDVAAFLAAERGRGMSSATVGLRRAAIRHLHHLAGLPPPTADARVSETLAGIRRSAAGERPMKKAAATLGVLSRILAAVPNDLMGLRDRALILLGFAGALRRSELAAVRVEDLEARERGLQMTLVRSKGERTGRAVTVAIPSGATELCPVRAVHRWLAAAGITGGPVFRRIWQPPSAGGRGGAGARRPTVGKEAIDARTVARIVQARAAAVGIAPATMGGHSLKRGALSEGMERGVHPTLLKRHGRHRSYAVLDEYIEVGDPFDGHPLCGIL